MGSVQLGVPHGLALALRARLGLRNFIETGTYKGGTTRWAAQHFDTVVTIEADPARWNKTHAALISEGLSYLAEPPGKVVDLHGNSGQLLGEVLATIRGPALVWLDAHYCGGEQMRDGPCPILDELAALSRYKDVGHCLLIDDERLFVEGPERASHARGWPSLSAILDMLPYPNILAQEDVIACLPGPAASIATEVRQWHTLPKPN